MPTLHLACPKRADDPARHLDVHVALPLCVEGVALVGKRLGRCMCGAPTVIVTEPAAAPAQPEGR